MGLFDFLKQKAEPSYLNVENENLRAISSRFRGSKEDTVYVSTSRICPVCSMYNKRVYSLFGRYKSFSILPDYLKNSICPTCGVHIGFSHYFPGINGNLQKDIKFSRRPYIDSRTAEEKSLWDNQIHKEQYDNKIQKDFNWICANLPELAPKSISGYKRMVNSNSQNYHKIVAAAKIKGYTI